MNGPSHSSRRAQAPAGQRGIAPTKQVSSTIGLDEPQLFRSGQVMILHLRIDDPK